MYMLYNTSILHADTSISYAVTSTLHADTLSLYADTSKLHANTLLYMLLF